MSELIIEAGPQDTNTISTLARQIWHAHYPGIISKEQIDYMIEKMYAPDALKDQMDAGHRFYLIYKDEQPCGYFSYSGDDTGYLLHKLYISVAHQAQGLGSKMMHFLLSLLPQGALLRLTVNRKNYKAVNFYFKNGFSIESVKDFDIGGGFYMNDFVMVRRV